MKMFQDLYHSLIYDDMTMVKIVNGKIVKSDSVVDRANITFSDGFAQYQETGYAPSVVFDMITRYGDAVFLQGRLLFGYGNIALAQTRKLDDNFRVVVSSNEKYYETTIPRITKSLKKEGIEDHVVVVGGCKEESTSVINGLTIIRMKNSLKGFNGLFPFVGGKNQLEKKYLFLLHDTCEVAPGFVESTRKIDVSLNSDFIGLCPSSPGFAELGLWRFDFLKKRPDLFGGYSISMENLKPFMRYDYVIGDKKEVNKRDVYMSGNKRTVVEFDLPLKKFTGGGRL